MTKVSEKLFLGSLDDADQLAVRNSQTIKTVVVLCADKPESISKGIRYVHIPVSDAQPIPRALFDSVMSAIEDGVKVGRVLVSCVAGMSRSPSLLAAYLHRTGFLDFDDAIGHLKKLRAVVNPSNVLVKSIKEHLRNG